MPVETGDVFFLCMAFDQAENAQEQLEATAREKQAELLRNLAPDKRAF